MSYYIMFSCNYISASQEPGDVVVDVVTEAGSKLGMTAFSYLPSERDLMLQRVTRDPGRLAHFLAELSQTLKPLGNDSNIAKESQGNVKKQTSLG